MRVALARLLLACLAAVAQTALAVPKWCGTEGCYEVLGVKESADPKDIRTSYYKLSRQWHPDKNTHPDAQKKFQRIAKAYEVLSDERSRKRYDYALAHPEQEILEEPYGVWKYWRTDVRLVLLGFLAAISAIQYFGKKATYDSALRVIKNTPKYKNRRKQLVEEAEARLDREKRAQEINAADNKAAAAIRQAQQASKGQRRAGGRLKSSKGPELPPEVVAEIDAQLESEVDIHGSQGKPTFRDTLAFQTVAAPYWFAKWAKWALHWHWAYDLMRGPYNEEDQIYLTRQTMHWSAPMWAGFPGDFREELVALQLWEPDNLKAFKREVKQGRRKLPRVVSLENTYDADKDPWAGIGDD